MDQYLDYGWAWYQIKKVDLFNSHTYRVAVQGRNLTNRMPLYIKPNRAISLNDTMWFMRTHFENTWCVCFFFIKEHPPFIHYRPRFDNAGVERPDVGAGAFNSPYRWRPVEW
jgi:dipeptidase